MPEGSTIVFLPNPLITAVNLTLYHYTLERTILTPLRGQSSAALLPYLLLFQPSAGQCQALKLIILVAGSMCSDDSDHLLSFKGIVYPTWQNSLQILLSSWFHQNCFRENF